MPVCVVTAVDPVLRDALVTGLLLDLPGVAALRYDVDTAGEGEGIRRLFGDAFAVLDDSPVEIEHACVSCTMREDAGPLLAHLASEHRWRGIVLAPPISADPEVVVRTLAPEADGWHLAPVLAAVDLDTARHDLLADDTLEERGLRWADGDERSVGEALCAQLEYADLIAPEGTSQAGRELVEHLRGPAQLMAGSLHELEVRRLLGQVHDRPSAEARRDPRVAEPYGGGATHGTFTLELRAQRPFHPERLLENVEMLGAGRLRSRGRFQVADRPGVVCSWDGAGGQIAIAAGEPMQDESVDLHDDGIGSGAVPSTAREPMTRLVVTGVDPADVDRVRCGFGRSLLTPTEHAEGAAPWLGTDDVLAPWLGRRGTVAGQVRD